MGANALTDLKRSGLRRAMVSAPCPPIECPVIPCRAISAGKCSAISAGETDRGRLVAGHRADVVVLPAAAMSEPVEPGGALWFARPRLVLMDGEVVAER